MLDWLKNRSEKERLEKKYCKLMKNAYEIALKNKPKSDSLNKEAEEVLHQLNSLKHAD